MIPSATTIQRYANTHGVDPEWRKGISINMIVHFLEVLDGQEVALDKDTWQKLAALKAWQVTKAVNNPAVTVSEMQNELAQVLFESERDALKDEGVPFNRYATKTHMVGRDVFGYGTRQLPWC